MGCDIHGVFQYRNNGEWKTDFDFYRGRNYELFSILAGVRNRFDIPPISGKKGLPEDFKEEVDLGDHSFSWLDIDTEVFRYNWEGPILKSGIVDREGYKKYQNGKKPDRYCQGIGGPKIISEDSSKPFIDPDFTHIKVYWVTTREYECHFFLEWLKTKMIQHHHPRESRIVFGFDS